MSLARSSFTIARTSSRVILSLPIAAAAAAAAVVDALVLCFYDVCNGCHTHGMDGSTPHNKQ
jgi:4-amino-4-deoxy-L-arabinose transferase-like glycosyltransferase